MDHVVAESTTWTIYNNNSCSFFSTENDSRTTMFPFGANDCVMMSHPPTLHYRTADKCQSFSSMHISP